MMKVKAGLHPPGGYFFVEPDGTKHTANGPNNAILKIKAYRSRNGLPPGDPRAEFYAAHCERNPTHCFSNAPVPAGGVGAQNPTKPRSLKGSVLSWLMGLRGRRGDLRWVDEATARARTDICTRCPKNQNISGTCNSCKAALGGLRSEILGGRKLADERGAGCAALNIDLPIGVMLDEPALAPEGLPPNCWRKRTV